MDIEAIAKAINAKEFDSVFTLSADGSMTRPNGIYAPYVAHDETTDITIDGLAPADDDKWEPLTGMTGQYGYHGAVMDASEFIGTGIARRMLDMCEDAPRTFTIVTVEVDGEDEEPAGWAILARKG